MLPHDDGCGEGGERFTDGGQFRQRLALAAAEVAFLDEMALVGDQQAAMLRCALDVVEDLVEFGRQGSILAGTPAAFAVRGREVVGPA